jgi:phage baseplate assembly protein W
LSDVEIAFPYHLDARGLSAVADRDAHVRQMLEQLLFTRPGERVNRPDFGCGLLDLIFGPNSPEVAAAIELTIGSSVQRWLGDVIQVDSLAVTNDESTIRVDLSYTLRATGATGSAVLAIPLGA